MLYDKDRRFDLYISWGCTPDAESCFAGGGGRGLSGSHREQRLREVYPLQDVKRTDPAFYLRGYDGRVLIDGEDTAAMDVGSLAKKVGYVYQDFENQIVRPTVLDDASFACMNYAMADYEERGGRALDACGLSQKKHDYIWQLSGGQKHLLALAGMLALSPKLLILDEPIAQLDPDMPVRFMRC